MNNLPDGVSENTYGAPWNDQSYCVQFVFIEHIIDMQFRSEQQEWFFTLTGPF